jgi:hypothetical protein
LIIYEFKGEPLEYRHEQFGTVIITMLAASDLLILILFVNSGILLPVFLEVFVIIFAMMALFYSLSIVINNGTLTCSFGIGVIQKRIPLSEIRQARAVNNPWYGGWGIHWIPGGCWLWNVSGMRGVELTFQDGHRLRVGTDEPETLVRAIETSKASGIKEV